MKRILLCLLLAAIVSAAPLCHATETSELLTQNDLRSLQPAYEEFLSELADLIIARGLLREEDREQWMMVQLGDFVQNGGFGTIVTMYTMDLLQLARPQETMLRLTKDFSFGTLTLQTMRGYNPLDASLPGLLLRADVTKENGEPVESRFRWRCSQGSFLVWDAFSGLTTEVGNTLINDGRPAYWTDQPIASGQEGSWEITVEILTLDDDVKVLGKATLILTPEQEGWLIQQDGLE